MHEVKSLSSARLDDSVVDSILGQFNGIMSFEKTESPRSAPFPSQARGATRNDHRHRQLAYVFAYSSASSSTTYSRHAESVLSFACVHRYGPPQLSSVCMQLVKQQMRQEMPRICSSTKAVCARRNEKKKKKKKNAVFKRHSTRATKEHGIRSTAANSRRLCQENNPRSLRKK